MYQQKQHIIFTAKRKYEQEISKIGYTLLILLIYINEK